MQLYVSVQASADGGNVSYGWFQIAGAGVKIAHADTSRASFNAPSLVAQQTLRFRITTRDDRGDVGSAEVQVVVEADPAHGGSEPPVAIAGVDATVDQGATVTLDGSNSTGSGLTFAWVQTSGSSTVALTGADGPKVFFVAPEYSGAINNRYVFQLTVRDSQGRTSTDSIQVTVRNPSPSTQKTKVRMKTTMGDIVVELEDALAPLTVANFLQYVDDQFYDGTIIHRVIKDFVIQGGGFTDTLAMKDTRPPIKNESDNGLKNDRGTIAMARTTDLNSASSQFYINLVNNDALNAKNGADGYTVFGHVIEGMDVVDAIGNVQTVTKGAPPDTLQDCPLQDIIVSSATREP